MKKILVILGALLLIILGISAFYWRADISDLAVAVGKSQLPPEVSSAAASAAAAKPSGAKFAGINLAVPFSAQAPYGDWSLPYAEACEETSAILVDHFYTGKALTPAIAQQEILAMVAWENKTFGFYEHTTSAETVRIIKEYLNYKRVDLLYDISLADIKAQIMAGRPVIVPLAGRMLNNPYYKNPGPIYHMLVIKGLTQDGKFITDDVGTKRGYNYVYNANVLYNAIHDAPFGGGELTDAQLVQDIPSGRKAIIVIYPN